MDVLKFMYNHFVNVSSATELVDVVMDADKFEVPSCLKFCVELLLKLPMSTELEVFFLGLPSTVLVNEVVQPLIVSVIKGMRDLAASHMLMNSSVTSYNYYKHDLCYREIIQ